MPSQVNPDEDPSFPGEPPTVALSDHQKPSPSANSFPSRDRQPVDRKRTNPNSPAPCAKRRCPRPEHGAHQDSATAPTSEPDPQPDESPVEAAQAAKKQRVGPDPAPQTTPAGDNLSILAAEGADEEDVNDYPPPPNPVPLACPCYTCAATFASEADWVRHVRAQHSAEFSFVDDIFYATRPPHTPPATAPPVQSPRAEDLPPPPPHPRPAHITLAHKHGQPGRPAPVEPATKRACTRPQPDSAPTPAVPPPPAPPPPAVAPPAASAPTARAPAPEPPPAGSRPTVGVPDPPGGATAPAPTRPGPVLPGAPTLAVVRPLPSDSGRPDAADLPVRGRAAASSSSDARRPDSQRTAVPPSRPTSLASVLATATQLAASHPARPPSPGGAPC